MPQVTILGNSAESAIVLADGLSLGSGSELHNFTLAQYTSVNYFYVVNGVWRLDGMAFEGMEVRVPTATSPDRMVYSRSTFAPGLVRGFNWDDPTVTNLYLKDLEFTSGIDQAIRLQLKVNATLRGINVDCTGASSNFRPAIELSILNVTLDDVNVSNCEAGFGRAGGLYILIDTSAPPDPSDILPPWDARVSLEGPVTLQNNSISSAQTEEGSGAGLSIYVDSLTNKITWTSTNGGRFIAHNNTLLLSGENRDVGVVTSSPDSLPGLLDVLRTSSYDVLSCSNAEFCRMRCGDKACDCYGDCVDFDTCAYSEVQTGLPCIELDDDACTLDVCNSAGVCERLSDIEEYGCSVNVSLIEDEAFWQDGEYWQLRVLTEFVLDEKHRPCQTALSIEEIRYFSPLYDAPWDALFFGIDWAPASSTPTRLNNLGLYTPVAEFSIPLTLYSDFPAVVLESPMPVLRESDEPLVPILVSESSGYGSLGSGDITLSITCDPVPLEGTTTGSDDIDPFTLGDVLAASSGLLVSVLAAASVGAIMWSKSRVLAAAPPEEREKLLEANARAAVQRGPPGLFGFLSSIEGILCVLASPLVCIPAYVMAEARVRTQPSTSCTVFPWTLLQLICPFLWCCWPGIHGGVRQGAEASGSSLGDCCKCMFCAPCFVTQTWQLMQYEEFKHRAEGLAPKGMEMKAAA